MVQILLESTFLIFKSVSFFFSKSCILNFLRSECYNFSERRNLGTAAKRNACALDFWEPKKNKHDQTIQFAEIRELGLELSDCRGQGYDGVGNMAGKYNGAATLIKNDLPLALYVHCSCHRLNLCVATFCKIMLIKNMTSNVKLLLVSLISPQSVLLH